MSDQTNQIDDLQEDQVIEEISQEEPEAEAEEAGQSDSPEDVKDRTREQFEKLLESNKALKEENEKLKEISSTDLFLNSPTHTPIQPSAIPSQQLGQLYNIPTSQVEDIAQSIFDEEGYVKKEELEKRLNNAQREAEIAKQQAVSLQEELRRNRDEIRRIEESAQTREAYKEFPQLNPNDENFDSEFRELVREKMLVQALNGQKDLVKACRDVSQLIGNMAKKGKQTNQEDVKREINATSGGVRKDVKSTAQDYERLMEAARYGKKGAIAELLKMRGS